MKTYNVIFEDNKRQVNSVWVNSFSKEGAKKRVKTFEEGVRVIHVNKQK